MFLCLFFLRQNETASFYQPIRMTRILWIRYFGGSLHTNSQNWWNNSKSKRWASILCLLTVQELRCESLLQSSSNVAAPVVRRRSGRVTRSTWWWRRSAATWSPSCSSSSTGESSEAEWQDRPMIESWSNEKINLSNFVQYKSLKRRILLLWLVRKRTEPTSLLTFLHSILMHSI